MGNITKIYLDWTRPLVETAAEHLRTLARGSFPADFSHLVIAVPTAEAGRQLRLRLAELCADSGGAVNLHITLPERILDLGETAGQEQVLMAWYETLRRADQRDFPELFRNGVLERFRDSADILIGWGEALQNARATLAREGWSLGAAAEKLDELCKASASETGEGNFTRFKEFAVLEEIYLSRLKRFAGERSDPAAAMLGAIADPRLPEGVEKIVLVDCADLAGAPERFLDRSGVAVECWINAPREYAEHFDAFGRPEPGFWNTLPLDLNPAKRVRIVPRPDQQAKKILELLTASPGLPSAVAVLDPEVVSALETNAAAPGKGRADHRKIEFFIPREIPLSTLPWSQLLLAVIRSALDGRASDAAMVWCDPFFADYARKVPGVTDLRAALEELDRLRGEHLAGSVKFVRKLLGPNPDRGARASLAALCALMESWRDRIAQSAHPVTAAYGILAELGGVTDVGRLDLRRSEGEIGLLRELVAALDRIDAPAEALFALLRRMLVSTRLRIREEPPGAIDVIGFLEVPWRTDSPVLIAGFNDTFLSAGTVDDMFLPDQARAALGMNTCDRRRAADALRFAALLERTGGEVYVLCGDSSHNGDKLFPARLLLQCGKGDGVDELARRTDLLFGEDRALVEEPPPFAESPKIMRMRDGVVEKRRMSITGFSAYIRCPFTFCLERMLGARHCNVDSPELDNPAFGTLVHSVLQELRGFEALDTPELEAALVALLNKSGERQFGTPLPGLLQLQLDMLREQLHYFAEAQSAEYRNGWRIVGTEFPLSVNWDELYRKVFPECPPEKWRAELTLVGKIDRIDRRTGEEGAIEVRVLDYKTAAAGESPVDTHLGKYSGPDDDCRLSAVSDDKGDELCWTDLQLPLYVLLVRHFIAGGDFLPRADRIVGGYFNLPQIFTETGVRMFDALEDEAVLKSAVLCADGILRRIFVEEKFWPPAGKDLELFPGSRIAVVDFRAPEMEKEVRP